MSYLHRIGAGLPLVLLLSASTYAEWVKVDITVLGQPGQATGFEQWLIASGGDTKTTTIGGLTFLLHMDTPPMDPNKYLKAGYNGKDGIYNNYKLAYDAVWPHWKPDPPDMPYPEGGSMSLTISGLPTGSHNIVTYHNNPWPQGATPGGWDRANNMTNTRIYVDGVYRKTITPTYMVTSDAACGYAFFDVNAVSGTPVVISMVPESTPASDIEVVFLNGFEVDAPGEPSAMAIAPVPADKDLHANCNNDDPAPGHAADGYTSLSWTPSAFAVAHGVYFGTDQTAITNATPASSGVYFGTQEAVTYPVAGLTSKLTYYWRIDETNAQGVTTKGAVWSFRPRRLAFPGAEGYGRFAHVGRYGRVIEVTNLNDSGAGSLRQAIEIEKGPRVIVFRVSGVIYLNEKIILPSDGGDVYIAGQTAPGDGICVAHYSFGGLGATDAAWRFIRTRVGDYCMKAMDGMGLASCDHSIMDHCSISWSIDEGHSSRGAKNITFQRNMIAEPLNDSYHYDDNDPNHGGTMPHGFAASISGRYGSYHHNLLAHCTQRNWSLAGGTYGGTHYDGYLEIVNNAVYNWQTHACEGGVYRLNFINNYYRPGAGTLNDLLMSFDGDELGWGDPQMLYQTGNRVIGRPAWDADNWLGTHINYGTEAMVRSDVPFFTSGLATQTANDAYANVLNDVGATRPKQDRIDARVITETVNGTFTYRGSKTNYPGFIDSQDDVGGYGTLIYRTYNVPADTDHDGLPDWWETMKGLNPNSTIGDFSDSNGDPDNDGYTNLDDYLSYLADGGSQLAYWKCTKSLLADFNGDCQVDFRDFAAFVEAWGSLPSISDINNDNKQNFKDLLLFSNDWLSCNRDPASGCWQ